MFLKLRALHSPKKEEELTSVFMTYKEEENSPSKNSNISTINSSTDSVKINSGKSSTPLEDITLKPSLSKSSASTSKKKSPQENSLSDCFIMYLSILFLFKNHQIQLNKSSLQPINQSSLDSSQSIFSAFRSHFIKEFSS